MDGQDPTTPKNDAQSNSDAQNIAETETVSIQPESLTDKATTVVPAEESSEAPTEDEIKAEPAPTSEPKAEESASRLAAEKPGRKSKKLFHILLALVILAAIAAGIYFAFFANSAPKYEALDEAAPDEATPVNPLQMQDNSLSDFDLSFLKNQKEQENIVYSPLSMKYTLAMLADGADGETKEQILNLIGEYKAKKYINSQNRSIANAMFVKDSYKNVVLPSYIEGLQSKYNANVIFDSFANANNVNNWVKNQTLGIIDHLADDKDVAVWNFALINALAIDMNWQYTLQYADGASTSNHYYNPRYVYENFSDEISPIYNGNWHKMTFNGCEGINAAEVGASLNNYDIVKELGEDKIRETVRREYEKWLKTSDEAKESDVEQDASKVAESYVSAISQNYHKSYFSTDFLWNETDEVKVFAKDLKEYDGATLQYIGIMPKTANLDEYLKSADAEKVSGLIKDLKEIKNENFEEGFVYRFKGNIPFFKYSSGVDMTEGLKALGITDAFDSKKADLSKMLDSDDAVDIYAVHKADINFSNDGIKAAAVSAIGGLGETGGGFYYAFDVPIKEIDMNFDKPFFYLIRDKASGEIWFSGAVYELWANQ